MQIKKERREIMKLSNKEAKMIIGGAGITGTLLNSLIKGFNTLMDIGRYLGSSLRRLIGGRSCPIN
jgi:hypothetical protein